MASSSTATENSGAKAATAAESYVGSLISLTSKSEIRYEGILYNINTEEASIGLKNVRSFGTEGRRKDGPQLPPGEKVYEFILFRGSDIKDLQVKSSAPAQPTSTVNNDPAIIQSHYPGPASASTSLPSAVSWDSPDPGSHSRQTGAPGSNIQGGQTGAAGSNFQGGQIGALGPNFQGGQTVAPSSFQGGQTGALGPIFQGGQTGAPGSNFQGGVPGSNFQGGLPLYQPGGNWAVPPNGVPMPMYWPGYYGPHPGLHQQSLLRPPPGLSMPPSQMQFPNFNSVGPPPTLQNMNMPTANLPASNLPTSMASGSNFPGSNLPTLNLPNSNLATSNFLGLNFPPSNLGSLNFPTLNLPPLPEFASPLLPPNSSSLSSSSTSLPTVTAPPIAPPVSSITAPETLPSSSSTKSTLPSISPLTSSASELTHIIPPVTSKANEASSFSILGNPNSIPKETQTATLATPNQLQSGPATVQSSQSAHKDVEVVQVPSPISEPSGPVAAKAQPPLLPLPVPSRPRAAQQPNGTAVHHQRNGTPFHSRPGFRGRERGRGAGRSRPIAKFTEDFDFEAMNEKFNKDEVWGDIGKTKSNDKEDDGKVNVEDDSQNEDDADLTKAVYNKDDFFDALSSNTINHDSQNGRPRYSEQRKIDTETFGDFPRYHRGGRGPSGGYNRGGPPRGGGYYGRGGYGYGGRGRGRGNMPNYRPL
ncbi:hypothetical protein ACFE04_029310 [Oxalis oulophora]